MFAAQIHTVRMQQSEYISQNCVNKRVQSGADIRHQMAKFEEQSVWFKKSKKCKDQFKLCKLIQTELSFNSGWINQRWLTESLVLSNQLVGIWAQDQKSLKRDGNISEVLFCSTTWQLLLAHSSTAAWEDEAGKALNCRTQTCHFFLLHKCPKHIRTTERDWTGIFVPMFCFCFPVFFTMKCKPMTCLHEPVISCSVHYGAWSFLDEWGQVTLH